MVKHCPKCNKDKESMYFTKDSKKKDGLSYYCKSCRSTYYKKYRKVNIDKIATDNKEWWKLNKNTECQKRKAVYGLNKEKVCATRRSEYKSDPLRFKNYDLKKCYGITLNDYNDMLERQNQCCAICQKHKSNFSKALAVDHCHNTGKVRGLLCTNCNRALGNLKDSIVNAKNAVKYLENQHEAVI